MLEMHTLSASASQPPQPMLAFQRTAPRTTAPLRDETDDHWALHLLDQLDYGVLVVRRELTVVHANRPARQRLGWDESLGGLRDSPRLPRDDIGTRRLIRAIEVATDQALRSTVMLRLDGDPAAVAVVPLRAARAPGQALAMLLFERKDICTQLALAGFGRLHGMTSAEIAVLAQLCAGREPAVAAAQLGVALSTVRTHVVAARNKLGAGSVREMLIGLARLPPIAEVVPR